MSLVTFVSVACVSSTAPGQQANVTIVVDKPTALLDQSLSIRATGLSPHQRVTIEARTTDSRGMGWSSRATFRTSGQGTVDLTRDRPLAGTYHRRDPMGLFWSMRPASGSATSSYYLPPLRGETVTLAATIAGDVVARRTIHRLVMAPRVRLLKERPAKDGFFGDLFLDPAAGSGRPAVLALGGSEGGLSTGYQAAVLASHGFPTLALAYFHEPGLPPRLTRIPLEYFAHALRWLKRRPGVDPHRIVVLGVSRGSEVAELLAVHFPRLVHGVIALVPSSVVHPSSQASFLPAWTLRGRPVAYTREWNRAFPSDVPAAIIPVERTRGPIFLACGEDDLIWPSCTYSDAIARRLKSHGFSYPYSVLRYEGAGHGVGFTIPYVAQGTGELGGTAPGDAAARQDASARLLRFMRRIAG